MPKLNGIDHIHVYVRDRAKAERWYGDVLGFTRVAALERWATPTGPLTLKDEGDTLHLALFERADHEGSTAIAFATDAQGFLGWKETLERKGLSLRIADHELAYSLYFHDLDNNMHEITTYEHEAVRARLGGQG